MKVKLTILVLGASLVPAAMALAASAPVAGGHYKGTDNSRFHHSNNSVTINVTKNGANFTHTRFNFVLSGQEGLGSCAGQAYVTVGSTKARQITRAGTFSLRGTFTFSVPTGPYPATKYTAHVTIAGAFGDRGRKVTGTLRETASSRGLTCRSGKVKFAASLVK